MTRAKIILISVILAAGVFGIFYSLGADEATADTVASDSQWSPSDAGERAEANQVEAIEVEDSGDWISTEWYVGEVTETVGQIEDLSNTMAEASFSAGDGYISMADYAMIADEAVTSVQSHIDYFEGVEPPQGYEEANGHLMDVLYNMRTGLEYARDGATYGDVAMINTGRTYISDAGASMDMLYMSLPLPIDY